jgi:anti-sigma B factor antagonist
MEINISTAGEVTVVEITGEIEASAAAQIQEKVLALIKPSLKLLMDMTEVKFMSSAGLRLLLLLYRQVTGQGGQMVLVGLSEEIQDTMSATGFLSFFTIQNTVDAGLGMLNQ